MIEVSVATSEAESSLINKILHKSRIRNRSIHRDLGDSMHRHGFVIHLKMSTDSTNTSSKEFLDVAPARAAATEALAYASF